MAKAGTRRVQTTTTEIVPVQGDPFAGALRAAIPVAGKLMIDGYCEAFWSLGEADAILHVHKRAGSNFTKKGELLHQEMPPTEVESHLISTWGEGQYQLRPSLRGVSYGPASVLYSLGEQEGQRTPAADVDSVIADTAKRIGSVNALEKLEDMTATRRGGGSMTEMLSVMSTIMTAMKPDNTVLLHSLDAANRRAEDAEKRNHDLMMKMMDNRQGTAQGAMPLLGELFKYMKPDHLQALLSNNTPEKQWWETLAELAREFAPALQAGVMELMKSSGLGRMPGVQAALPPAGQPQPTAATDGGGSMPIPLNPEQEMSKGFLIEFIKIGDFANAAAALEAFPGFIVTQAGPLPVGQALIMQIDPKVSPKVYFGQMLQVMPELKDSLAQVEAFIKHIQSRILADDDAAAQARPNGQGPHPTPVEGAA